MNVQLHFLFYIYYVQDTCTTHVVHCRHVLPPKLLLNAVWIAGNSSIPTYKLELLINGELHRQCTICYCTTDTYCNNSYCIDCYVLAAI